MKNIFIMAIAITSLSASGSKSNQEHCRPTAEQILSQAEQIFSKSKDLTNEQKQKLKVVYTRTYDSAQSIQQEIRESKSQLFKTLATKDYRAKDVEDLKERLVALDKNRIDLMFDALDQVQLIVGNGTHREELYKHIFDFEGPDYDDVARKER